LKILFRPRIYAMNIEYSGIGGLLIIALDIWAIVNILQSPATYQKKWIWTIAVALLPLLGLILWHFRGLRIGKA
jgi:succinate dehydrogenase/fumarate reductase cytochrome b subunit